MFLIQETTGRTSDFQKFMVDNDTGKKTLIKTVQIRSMNKNYQKADYCILYDSNMIPIKEAFEFLNYEFLNASDNTKVQALSALRLLYSYLELFDLNIELLNDTDIKNFKHFLRGYSPKGSFISINLLTDRSNVTINTYLGIYRKYVDFLNLSNSPLLKIKPIKSKVTFEDSTIQMEIPQYVHSERVSKFKTVPRYISLPEYKRILEVIDNKENGYSLREKCIVRLMFEGGLRIGEVLGLTAEDVTVEEFYNERENKTFKSGVVYIRNRITDKPYQLAKRRLIITNRRTYSSKIYREDTKKAFISVKLADLIFNYLNDAHDNSKRPSDASKKLFDKNYKKYTITDIVDKKANIDEDGFKILDDNYYIFINSLGKPINKSTWNKILREILQKSNIKLDSGKKIHNLNHRFRHGFAMFYVQYKKIKIEDLMKLLRHESISSTAVYYRPTDDDIALLRDDFSATLEELVPIISLEGFE